VSFVICDSNVSVLKFSNKIKLLSDASYARTLPFLHRFSPLHVAQPQYFVSCSRISPCVQSMSINIDTHLLASARYCTFFFNYISVLNLKKTSYIATMHTFPVILSVFPQLGHTVASVENSAKLEWPIPRAFPFTISASTCSTLIISYAVDTCCGISCTVTYTCAKFSSVFSYAVAPVDISIDLSISCAFLFTIPALY
jgi:hypothetical protein